MPGQQTYKQQMRVVASAGAVVAVVLAAAFVLSPYGLPMLGAWLVAQLHLLRDWMKEKVY